MVCNICNICIEEAQLVSASVEKLSANVDTATTTTLDYKDRYHDYLGTAKIET